MKRLAVLGLLGVVTVVLVPLLVLLTVACFLSSATFAAALSVAHAGRQLHVYNNRQ